MESPIENEEREILCGDCLGNWSVAMDGVFQFVKWIEDENGNLIEEEEEFGVV